MSNTEDLKDALRGALESQGVMDDIKARLRKEVFHALDDKGCDKPELCRENLLINELIREYLTFNKYNYSCSVLLAESGQPQEPLERAFLLKELNLHQDTGDKVPILYHILSLLSRKSPESQQVHADHNKDEPQGRLGTSHTTLASKHTIEEPTISNTV